MALILLKDEVNMTRLAVKFSTLSYNEKKQMIDGPISDLMQRAVKIISKQKSVAFLAPGETYEILNYEFKAEYYLYPRKVHFIEMQTNMVLGDLKHFDYFTFVVPELYWDALHSSLLQESSYLRPIFVGRVHWSGRNWIGGVYANINDGEIP